MENNKKPYLTPTLEQNIYQGDIATDVLSVSKMGDDNGYRDDEIFELGF